MSTPSPGKSLHPAEQSLSPQTSIAGYRENMMSSRSVFFLTVVIASLLVFEAPLRALVHYAISGTNPYDKYSYTMAIPFISVVLLFSERRRIFAGVQYGLWTGAFLLLAGLILYWSAGRAFDQLGAPNYLSTSILALVTIWLGGFILCYGGRAFRAAIFPLLFLFLTVPIPDSWLDKPITAVQHGSGAVCSAVFSLIGVPVLRDGLDFFLSNITVRIARECSGIHSTLAIFIISLLAGHLYLSSAWKKVVLVLLALPVVCVTNGLRIAGLTLLTEYVDAGFLQGSLHHRGGIAFFLLALLILFGLVRLIRGRPRSEMGSATRVKSEMN